MACPQVNGGKKLNLSILLQKRRAKPPKRIIDLNVPRDQVVAFALYTVDGGTLKLTGQSIPASSRRIPRSQIRNQAGKTMEGNLQSQNHLSGLDCPL